MAKEPENRDLPAAVDVKVARRMRAKKRTDQTAWFGFRMFGLVGWAVAVPTVLGIALGIWLDRHWPGRISWTLTMLITGTGVGCMNAWYWIKREASGNDDD